MNFEESLKAVGLAEGPYSNDADDSGGETICGLARNKNPDLSIWQMLDTWKARGNTGAQLDKVARSNPEFMAIVKATYRGRYWQTIKADTLPALLRYPMFSCAVNCGYKVAIALLQKALGVKVDGIFGAQTYRALNATTSLDELLDKFYNYWATYYKNIAAKKTSQQKYLHGWLARIENVKQVNHI